MRCEVVGKIAPRQDVYEKEWVMKIGENATGFIKAAAGSPRVHPGEPLKNAAEICSVIDQAQALKAIREAEAYNGPSIIIAYAPCINHIRQQTSSCGRRFSKVF